MKSIACWNDLAGYGIVPLTAEACGLMYRLLCDVTEDGKRILEKALGLRGLDLPENWNNGSPERPHVGSIMLAPELLIPLGVFALLENGCDEVWLVESTLLGFEPTDGDAKPEILGRFDKESRTRVFRYGGTAGDRNIHQMTGRIV